MSAPEKSPAVSPVAPAVKPLDDRNFLLRRLLLAAGVPTILLLPVLYPLIKYAVSSDLYSHIPLIPLVSGYLIWTSRSGLPGRFIPDYGLATLFFALGVAALGGHFLLRLQTPPAPPEDVLALGAAAYVLLLVGSVSAVLGRAFLRASVFPLAFLVFMVPMPVVLHEAVEVFLQHGSADVSAAMIRSVGTPLFRDGLVFQLPGITLQVAPECSGIHSTLALFITSTVAGHLFLKSWLHRTVLAVAVIPLALLRNGFRIFTIGELCVHVDPEMIHSFIHRQGGPIFFALSLIPFSILLWFLRRRERPATLS